MGFRLERNRQYGPEEIVRAARGPIDSVEVTEDVRADLQSSRKALDTLVAEGRDVYGVTTGFGELVDYPAHDDTNIQGERLIYHLSVGTGDSFTPEIGRAALLLRAITLSRGYSGVRESTFKRYCDLISSGLAPGVPKMGSLGASGDLIPMANAILSLMGEGTHQNSERTVESHKFIEEHDLEPLEVDAREALALVNGVPVCTAVGCFALERLDHLFGVVEDVVTWLYASMGCSDQSLSDQLNTVKGHPDQKKLAGRLREKLSEKTVRSAGRPVQEVYSIRGVPQILGAAHRSLRQSRNILWEELNGVDDNPIVYRENDRPRVEHGANFVGQSLAFAFDQANEALTQVANLVERQLSVLLDPERNGGYEAMLAGEAGSNTGLAGAQLNATSILSSIRNNDQSYGSSSLSTNGGNQDVVPMTMEAGRNLMDQLDRFRDLLAIHGLALRQYDHRVRASDESFSGNQPDWFPDVKPLTVDRPLKSEIQTIAESIQQNF